MSEALSPADTQKLAPFFTNLTEPIFGLKLPQEVAGALFSRYSRSSKSLRQIFLDEFLGQADLQGSLFGDGAAPSDDSQAIRKARAFYDRVLVGYGDDSVAQLGGAHIACEGISNVAAKILEDARVGIAPLEKSTRYVRFDTPGPDGDYLFYKEPTIMGSSHREAYLSCLRHLFETYAAQIEPMIAFVRDSLPIDTVEWKHPQTGDPLTYTEAQRDETLRRWAEGAYRSTVRAHACDILRSYLPAATLTNVGIFGVGQAFEHLLNKLYSLDLAEAQDLAKPMHKALEALIPSFVKRAQPNEYLVQTAADTRALAQTLLDGQTVQSTESVSLVDYDRNAEDRILTAILYSNARLPLGQVRSLVKKLPAEQRGQVFDTYIGQRRHRRDKPGRALEHAYYTFDIIGNLGIYRDLQRHRILTQERQDFTTVHGYDAPPEIEQAGFQSSFTECMERAAAVYERIFADFPAEAQYVVPFAYRVRWYMKLNLREAIHMGELRTLPQGHPDYRIIVQEMWRLIGKVHPALARSATFLDWQTYRLGRLQSEMRTEYKKSRLTPAT